MKQDETYLEVDIDDLEDFVGSEVILDLSNNMTVEGVLFEIENEEVLLKSLKNDNDTVLGWSIWSIRTAYIKEE